MRYSFICVKCHHVQDLFFAAADYDEEVHNSPELDGLHRTEKCEKCGQQQLYRHITNAAQVMGGTGGYKSMDRYWSENPGLRRKKEEDLNNKLEERHRKKVLDNINKQSERLGRDKRHEGYGPDSSEEKLNID